MARQKFTYTPEEFGKRVRWYFHDCEEVKNVFPDESGMLNLLEISDSEYEALKRTRDYGKIIMWARRKRTSWLERHMVENGRAANGCMNALKQEKNGGYADRSATPVKEDRKLIVKLVGIDPGGLKK